jgi:hypothetical protein
MIKFQQLYLSFETESHYVAHISPCLRSVWITDVLLWPASTLPFFFFFFANLNVLQQLYLNDWIRVAVASVTNTPKLCSVSNLAVQGSWPGCQEFFHVVSLEIKVGRDWCLLTCFLWVEVVYLCQPERGKKLGKYKENLWTGFYHFHIHF